MGVDSAVPPVAEAATGNARNVSTFRTKHDSQSPASRPHTGPAVKLHPHVVRIRSSTSANPPAPPVAAIAPISSRYATSRSRVKSASQLSAGLRLSPPQISTNNVRVESTRDVEYHSQNCLTEINNRNITHSELGPNCYMEEWSQLSLENRGCAGMSEPNFPPYSFSSQPYSQSMSTPALSCDSTVATVVSCDTVSSGLPTSGNTYSTLSSSFPVSGGPYFPLSSSLSLPVSNSIPTSGSAFLPLSNSIQLPGSAFFSLSNSIPTSGSAFLPLSYSIPTCGGAFSSLSNPFPAFGGGYWPLPGSIPGALPGSIPGALPNSIPGALSGSIPEAFPGVFSTVVTSGVYQTGTCTETANFSCEHTSDTPIDLTSNSSMNKTEPKVAECERKSCFSPGQLLSETADLASCSSSPSGPCLSSRCARVKWCELETEQPATASPISLPEYRSLSPMLGDLQRSLSLYPPVSPPQPPSQSSHIDASPSLSSLLTWSSLSQSPDTATELIFDTDLSVREEEVGNEPVQPPVVARRRSNSVSTASAARGRYCHRRRQRRRVKSSADAENSILQQQEQCCLGVSETETLEVDGLSHSPRPLHVLDFSSLVDSTSFGQVVSGAAGGESRAASGLQLCGPELRRRRCDRPSVVVTPQYGRVSGAKQPVVVVVRPHSSGDAPPAHQPLVVPTAPTAARAPAPHRVRLGVDDLGPALLARTKKGAYWRQQGPGDQGTCMVPHCLSAGSCWRAVGSKFECVICNKQFAFKSGVTRHHRMAHHLERRYECASCGALYFLLSDLKRHLVASHTKIQPYRCVRCSSQFGRLSDLRKHVCR